jgi:hypothetical protein
MQMTMRPAFPMTVTSPSGAVELQFSCLIHTLGRPEGDGIAFVTVAAPNATTAESTARRLAQARFGCICDVADVTPVAA